MIFYERRGPAGAPAVLLLHGIGSNHRAFRHQLSGLSDAYDLIAWDAPGYAESSDPPATGFSLEDMADCAVELLDSVGVAQAHLLGVSMGGVVAQLMYHRHRSRVLSLVLCDTNAGGGAAPEPERTRRIQARVDAITSLGPRRMAEQRSPVLVSEGAPSSLVEELTEIMAEVRPAGYIAAAVALGATDLTQRLGDIAVPTLVVHGDCDRVVPLATGRELAAAIPGAQLAVLPGAGHVANQEQPDAFNAAVRQFLA